MSHIAYIAGYQGPGIIAKRKINRNLAFAGSRKIKLISQLLLKAGHTPVIISEAYTSERSGKIFSRLSEQLPDIPDIKVHYAASIDIRFINIIVGFLDTILLLLSENKRNKIDCVIVYNFSIFQVIYTLIAKLVLRIPVFLDYEDDARVNRNGKWYFIGWLSAISGDVFRNLLSGCFAVSPALISQIGHSNSFLLRGCANNEIISISKNTKNREKIVLYTGSMDPSKGVDRLVDAWLSIENWNGWSLEITGNGEMASKVIYAAEKCSNIHYHGIVSNDKLTKLLSEAQIGINPHLATINIGNIFPFKVIEYLAAGLIVLSTPMLEIEDKLEKGIIFSASDSVAEIASVLKCSLTSTLIADPSVAEEAARLYGENAVLNNMNLLLKKGGIAD